MEDWATRGYAKRVMIGELGLLLSAVASSSTGLFVPLPDSVPTTTCLICNGLAFE